MLVGTIQICRNYGDVALKAGWDVERVRALYRSAQSAPNYARWPFAPALEQRIEQAEAYAQDLKDDDPLNDPIVGLDNKICSGCHLLKSP